MKKTLTYALLGVVLGLIISGLTIPFKNELSLDNLYLPFILFLSFCSLVTGIFYIVNSQLLKKLSLMNVSYEEEDLIESKLNKKYNEIVLSNTIFLILSTTACITTIISNQPIWLSIITIILLLLSILTTPLLNSTVKIVYKNRNLPEATDRKFNDQLFQSADEGERYMMLNGLYSSFKLMNILLPLSLLILMFYTELTGKSQFFSIIVIAIIIITINARYLLKMRANY